MADILLSEKMFCHTVRHYHENFKGIKDDLHAKLKFTQLSLRPGSQYFACVALRPEVRIN